MRQILKQLADALRGHTVRDAQPARGTQLGIETLESRTVLSADFGAVREFMELREDFPLPPLVMLDHAAGRTLFAEFIDQQPELRAEAARWAWQNLDGRGGPSADDGLRRDPETFEPRGLLGKTSGPFGVTGNQNPESSSELSPEDRPLGSYGLGDKDPQSAKAAANLHVELDLNAGNDDALASTFTSLQRPAWESIVQRFMENRHVATPSFLSPMISVTTDSDLNAGDDVGSLLATYASWAASSTANDAATVTHDAAFDDYAVTGEDEANRAAYLQILAEDQAGSRPIAETGGFVDLGEAGVVDAEKLSNLAAENQRQAIESALRTLEARRGGGRTMLQVEDLLEQAWLTAAAAKSTEATANQLAEEPGGMILLQSLPNETVDDLFAAGGATAIVRTTVEMEATIGAFQAFDVSVDEASAVMIKPATGDVGANLDRATQKDAAATDHQAAGGFGALAIGAMALAAKRRINNRRRKPK